MQTFEDYLYDHVEESRLNKLGDEEYKRHANAFAMKVQKESIERAMQVMPPEKIVHGYMPDSVDSDANKVWNEYRLQAMKALKTLLH